MRSGGQLELCHAEKPDYIACSSCGPWPVGAVGVALREWKHDEQPGGADQDLPLYAGTDHSLDI